MDNKLIVNYEYDPVGVYTINISKEYWEIFKTLLKEGNKKNNTDVEFIGTIMGYEVKCPKCKQTMIIEDEAQLIGTMICFCNHFGCGWKGKKNWSKEFKQGG